jgi:hypothetical protein
MDAWSATHCNGPRDQQPRLFVARARLVRKITPLADFSSLTKTLAVFQVLADFSRTTSWCKISEPRMVRPGMYLERDVGRAAATPKGRLRGVPMDSVPARQFPALSRTQKLRSSLTFPVPALPLAYAAR